MMKKKGIGSYFHFENFKPTKGSDVTIPFDYEIFYTGRHALLYILNKIASENKISKIWFPNYYCQHTMDWIKKTFPDINIYEINPFKFTSDKINLSEFASKDDVVLINNYWGLSTMLITKIENSPIIIEDHSHGWLSDACLNSIADFCFVSLRKSLPIPLGGICWQPKSKVSKRNDDFKNDKVFYKIWDLMLNAMQIKKDYIQGNSTVGSNQYLPMFYKVEKSLNEFTEFVSIQDEHKQFIDSYINFNTRKVKDKNLQYLYSNLDDTSYYKIIKKANRTAFGFLLLFKDETAFNSLKNYLVSNGIYPSSLWPDNKIEYKWKYFLNIHTDYRYTIIDMEYIAFTITNWLKNYN